jgi:hypothetical protein
LSLRGLTGLALLVDAYQFAEAKPVVLRHRLDTPLVLSGVVTLSTLGTTQRRVRVLALQCVVGVADLSSSLQISVRLNIG